MFVEGYVRDTESLKQYIEVRIDGPNITEYSKNCWKLYFEVNVLITTRIDLFGDGNVHGKLKGDISKLFVSNICVHRYGSQTDDDREHIGCLKRVAVGRERIQVSDFGQIRPDTKLRQATVEGHYEIFFD